MRARSDVHPQKGRQRPKAVRNFSGGQCEHAPEQRKIQASPRSHAPRVPTLRESPSLRVVARREAQPRRGSERKPREAHVCGRRFERGRHQRHHAQPRRRKKHTGSLPGENLQAAISRLPPTTHPVAVAPPRFRSPRTPTAPGQRGRVGKTFPHTLAETPRRSSRPFDCPPPPPGVAIAALRADPVLIARSEDEQVAPAR